MNKNDKRGEEKEDTTRLENQNYFSLTFTYLSTKQTATIGRLHYILSKGIHLVTYSSYTMLSK